MTFNPYSRIYTSIGIFLLCVSLAVPFLCLQSCKQHQSKEKTFEVAQIVTNYGEMLVWLYDETSLHKSNFIQLANEGYWDTLTFNRVIEDFVIQGGCPDTPAGFSDSPYLLPPEFHQHLRHQYGALGAGRDDNPDKLSAGCQFYIVHDKRGIQRLDNNYTIYGQVFKGHNVLDSIATLPTDSLDAPLDPVTMDVNIIEMTNQELNDLTLERYLQ